MLHTMAAEVSEFGNFADRAVLECSVNQYNREKKSCSSNVWAKEYSSGF